MKRLFLRFLLIILGAFFGAIAGTLFFIDFFGNYLPSIQLFGNRGYEAGAWFGFILGGVLGILCGFYLSKMIFREKNPKTHATEDGHN